MDESNEYLIMLDPSSKNTASDMRSITSVYPDNRPVFENVIAIYSDDDFLSVTDGVRALLRERDFLIAEVSDNVFGQGNF